MSKLTLQLLSASGAHGKEGAYLLDNGVKYWISPVPAGEKTPNGIFEVIVKISPLFPTDEEWMAKQKDPAVVGNIKFLQTVLDQMFKYRAQHLDNKSFVEWVRLRHTQKEGALSVCDLIKDSFGTVPVEYSHPYEFRGPSSYNIQENDNADVAQAKINAKRLERHEARLARVIARIKNVESTKLAKILAQEKQNEALYAKDDLHPAALTPQQQKAQCTRLMDAAAKAAEKGDDKDIEADHSGSDDDIKDEARDRKDEDDDDDDSSSNDKTYDSDGEEIIVFKCSKRKSETAIKPPSPKRLKLSVSDPSPADAIAKSIAADAIAAVLGK